MDQGPSGLLAGTQDLQQGVSQSPDWMLGVICGLGAPGILEWVIIFPVCDPLSLFHP